jgi:hypothetical protein
MLLSAAVKRRGDIVVRAETLDRRSGPASNSPYGKEYYLLVG